MVDFQSRTTRRGTDDTADDEAAESDDSGTDESEESPASQEQVPDGSAEVPEEMTFAVVSVSSDRTVEHDPPGDAVVTAVERSGGSVVTRQVVAPSYDGVQSAIDTLVDRNDVGAVVTTGGTGVEPDDVTIQAVESLLDKELPGFGELFRLLCHERTGSAIIRTRATAGIAGAVPIFCLPGNEPAAQLGANEVVVPEAETLRDIARDGNERP